MGVVYSFRPNGEDNFDYEEEHVELESDKKEYGDDGAFEESDTILPHPAQAAESEKIAGLRDVSMSEAALLVLEQEQKHEATAETKPEQGERTGSSPVEEQDAPPSSRSRQDRSVLKKEAALKPAKKAMKKGTEKQIAAKRSTGKSTLKKSSAKKTAAKKLK